MFENLQLQLKKFLQQHDALGWFIVMIGVSLVAQFVLFVLLSLVSATPSETFYTILSYVALPASLQEGVTRPWTLFTWPFVSLHSYFHFGEGGEDFRTITIFRFLISGYIMYAFGRIGQQLLGSERLRRFILLCIPVIGLIVMLLGTAFYTGENAPAVTYLSGMMPLVVALLVATAALVPNYPIPLFFFGQVKLKWLAIIFVALEFISGSIFTPFSWAILLAAGFGFGYIYLMRQGTDIVEIVSSWFRKKEPVGAPPKAEPGKVRSMKMRPQATAKANAPADDGPVPQEEVDRILDKITENGYESLTRIEKERLLRASEDKNK